MDIRFELQYKVGLFFRLQETSDYVDCVIQLGSWVLKAMSRSGKESDKYTATVYVYCNKKEIVDVNVRLNQVLRQ